MTRCLLLGWVRWALMALAIIQTVLFHFNFHNRDKEGTFPELMEELLWMKQEVTASRNSTISSTTSSERSKDDIPVVAYATTISKCGVVPQKYNESNSPWKDIFALQDAAAVFAHSIHLASYPLHPTARYRSKLYAFIPTKNSTAVKGMKPCIQALSNVGFTVLLRDLPVENPMSHLTREFPVLKKRFPDKPWKWKPRKLIGKDGCCGQNELLKLRMFELVDHPVAVHLDLDSLILAPLDDLFDVIVHNNSSVARQRIVEKGYIAPTYNNPHQTTSNNNGILPQRIDTFYTKDWNMAKHDLKVGVQGGFLVARPDLAVYKQLQEIIETGNYVIKGDDRKKQGWGRLGYGGQIEGSMTFQGLMAYYYGEISHDTAVELNRCRINQMADNPRQTVGFPRVRPTPLNSTMATKLGWSDGNCKDGRHDCDDVQCQTWLMAETLSIHFTHCLKPWTCPNPEEKWGGTMAQAACEALHHEWFRVRADLEERGSIDDSFGIEPVNATGTFYSRVFGGYCGNATTDLGYVKMRYKAGRDS